MDFKNDKELFDYVRNFQPDSVQSLKDIFSKYKLEEIDINYVLGNIYKNRNIFLIDARTPKEFEESSVPGSVNFPVLENNERHYVGLVYKKYSSTSAVKLAMEFANPKIDKLRSFLSLYNSDEKDIIVYCWRGGGRSKYLSAMIFDIGYKCRILKGGIKSYRRKVNEFWNRNPFPYDLIEISGLTGSGKTEIIRALSDSLPVIDLEDAAKHYSSLFGFVPYFIKNISEVKNQSAFENNIFAQIIKSRNSVNFRNLFFIESESKKVGDFFIPPPLFDKLNNAPCIYVQSSLHTRINRIVNDYFGNDLQGLEPMLKIFIEKGKFFRKELSNKVYDKLLNLLISRDVHQFTEIMLTDYYDRKYKVKPKKPLFTVNSDNISESVRRIEKYYSSVGLNCL